MPKPAASSSVSSTTARPTRSGAPARRSPAKAKAAGAPTVRRKAPTPIKESATEAYLFRKYALIASGITVLVIGLSVGVGVSDAGVIDVSERITARNEAVAAGEIPEGETSQSVTKTISAQKSQPAAPNGGLVGFGNKDPRPAPPPPEPVMASSSASTSPESVASSTDDVPSEPELEPEGAGENNPELEASDQTDSSKAAPVETEAPATEAPTEAAQ